MHTTLMIALFTAALLGFRHGFDYDHVAAITDVVSVQSSRRVAMKIGMVYALGHALKVAALGFLVIVLGIRLPASVDRWAERLVGLTLLLLGAYIISTLIFRPAHHLPKSRYMLFHKGYHRAKLAWKPRRRSGQASVSFAASVVQRGLSLCCRTCAWSWRGDTKPVNDLPARREPGGRPAGDGGPQNVPCRTALHEGPDDRLGSWSVRRIPTSSPRSAGGLRLDWRL